MFNFRNRMTGTIAVLALFSTFSVRAAILNPELKRLQRCYALLTSNRIPTNHPLITQVKNGTITGAAACMQIFDQAQLGSNNQVNTSDSVALNIIRKMHEVNRSFFEIKDFINSFAYDSTSNIIDNYDPANFLTYLLLKPNQTFSTAVTGTNGYKALRNSVNPTTRKLLRGFQSLHFNDGNTTVNPILIREGKLVGLEPDTTVNTITNYPTGMVGNNVNAHKGAGIIGLQAYILANGGLHFPLNPDGGIYTYRRWGKNVMKDLLCRDMPSVRPGDVSGLVAPASSLAYRKSESCVMCHATMDRLGATIRNQIGSRSSGYDSEYAFLFLATRPASVSSADNFPTEPDSSFSYRPATGKLSYRSYDGTFVNLDVASLADLGSKLADTNDLYVCAAKHYYQFLTGIDANLNDPGNPNTQTFTTGELFHRNNVINLGLSLKSDQSLRELFRRIFESSAFLYPDRGQ